MATRLSSCIFCCVKFHLHTVSPFLFCCLLPSGIIHLWTITWEFEFEFDPISHMTSSTPFYCLPWDLQAFIIIYLYTWNPWGHFQARPRFHDGLQMAICLCVRNSLCMQYFHFCLHFWLETFRDYSLPNNDLQDQIWVWSEIQYGPQAVTLYFLVWSLSLLVNCLIIFMSIYMHTWIPGCKFRLDIKDDSLASI